MDILVNCLQILGIAFGGPTMILGFMHIAAGNKRGMMRILLGAAIVTGGLATPGGSTHCLPPIDEQFFNKIA